MMSNPSERCKQWEDFYYWNCTDDEGKHFIKFIRGDCRRGGMSMPDEFVKNFNGSISKTIELETRSGSTCDVQLAKHSEKLVHAGHGWEAFAGAHNLRSTDFAVFRYSGGSRFKVLLFDATGCEKSSSCVSLKNVTECLVDSAEAKQDDDPVLQIQTTSSGSHGHPSPAQSPQAKEEEGRARPRPRPRPRPRRSCLSRSKKIIELSSSSSQPDGSTGGDGSASSSEEDGCRSAGAAAKSGWWCVVDGDPRRILLSGCIFPRGTRLTRAQKEAVEKTVRAVGSELPLYGAVITKNRACSGRLVFCRAYTDKWLPGEGQGQTVSLRRRELGRAARAEQQQQEECQRAHRRVASVLQGQPHPCRRHPDPRAAQEEDGHARDDDYECPHHSIAMRAHA